MTRGFTKNGKFHPTDRKKKGLSSSEIHGQVGYNVRLKKKEVIKRPMRVTTKNGRHAIKGVGSDGTIMFKFIK